MVEQLTFNQWVAGSIPAPLTNKTKDLDAKTAPPQSGAFAWGNAGGTGCGRERMAQRIRALAIRARAEMRLAEEYDAAQERGEVATRQNNP